MERPALRLGLGVCLVCLSAVPLLGADALDQAKRRGAAQAQADIAQGTRQILYYGKPWSQGKPLVDDQCQLPVKIVAGCDVAAEFVAETDAYNTVMRQAAKGQKERELATAAFRAGPQNPKRAEAAKVLYPAIRIGMSRSDVILLLGVPDGAKHGQLVRFMDYTVGPGQEIEIEFDPQTEKVIRKHEVGLGLDPPPAAPAAIPAKLQPYVKDYTTADTTLRAGFVPAKPELVWGEPLEVTFTVENLGPKDFEFMFGGDYRGTGRHNRIQIEVVDAAGQLLPDPHANAPDFGGILSREIVTPGGRTFTRMIDLQRFRTLAQAGAYTVTCRFAFDEPFTRQQGPAKPIVKSSFRLTILERTPQRVAKILDELVAQAETAPDKDLAAALALIARFGQDDAAPRLIGLTRNGPLPRRAAAYAALPLAPTEASLQAALAGLTDAEPAIRAAAAGALGGLQKPQGVAALLAALTEEKSPVAEAILIALGNSKSPQALPALAGRLASGTPELKAAAVTALVAYGGPEAVATLQLHVATHDLALRHQIVLALAEKLRQPLNTDWLVPVLMCRAQDQAWHDSLRLLRMYGGDKAIPGLLSCLDFDVAWSYRNWWILNEVRACPNAPAAEYAYDPNSDGTPAQWEQNRETLLRLKKLAGPIAAAPPRPIQKRLADLATDPPIDFTPRLKPVAGAVEVQSGFLKLTINRNGYTNPYVPTEAYRPLYQLASHVRALLARPDLFDRLGITPQQAQQLRQLSLPPDRPGDTGWTQLYIAYKDAPPGPLQQQAADDLGEAVRAASQSYHAAHAALAAGAQRILTAAQIEQLPPR